MIEIMMILKKEVDKVEEEAEVEDVVE